MGCFVKWLSWTVAHFSLRVLGIAMLFAIGTLRLGWNCIRMHKSNIWGLKRCIYSHQKFKWRNLTTFHTRFFSLLSTSVYFKPHQTRREPLKHSRGMDTRRWCSTSYVKATLIGPRRRWSHVSWAVQFYERDIQILLKLSSTCRCCKISSCTISYLLDCGNQSVSSDWTTRTPPSCNPLQLTWPQVSRIITDRACPRVLEPVVNQTHLLGSPLFQISCTSHLLPLSCGSIVQLIK